MAGTGRNEVRIVVLGDPKVGKTSLITVMVTERFQDQVAPTAPVVTIPPDSSLENVTTHIVDTSSRPQDQHLVESEIRQADGVCLLYDVGRHETFQRVHSFWLPEIRRILHDAEPPRAPVPVVLIANKIDLHGPADPMVLQQSIAPIMNEYKEVETCVECSAKKNINVHEIFFFAQKAILYPTSVVFDAAEAKLKQPATDALRRIFYICDGDHDGALSNDELNQFQTKCFGQELNPEEIDSVKERIQKEIPEGVNDRGVTLAGFLFLHHIFIEPHGKLEVIWTVFRRFGYGDDLNFRPEVFVPLEDVEANQTVELGDQPTEYLRNLFLSFDKDNDKALSAQEIEQLFQPCGRGSSSCPWGKDYLSSVQTDGSGHITLQGFLAYWALWTAADWKRSLRDLACLGYESDDKQTQLDRTERTDFPVRWNRETEKETEELQRRVLRGLVVGKEGSGKTSFLKSFLGKKLSAEPSATDDSLTVVNAVQAGGSSFHLILHEKQDRDDVLNSADLPHCDLICLLFDQTEPSSFPYVANVYDQLRHQQRDIYTVFLQTKADLAKAASKRQKGDPVLDFFASRKLPQASLRTVSAKENNDALFSSMVSEIVSSYKSRTNLWGVLLGAGVLLAICGGGYFAYRRWKRAL